jgi:hypothetical protein
MLIAMRKKLFRIALVTGCLLLVPLVAMQFTEQVQWNLFDFLVMGSLLFGIGLAYELVARKVSTTAYRVAVGFALAAVLLLIWVNAAVGIIGDGPVNALYLAVVAVLIIGAAVARLKPRGMVRALCATALAQALVPMIALVLGVPDFSPGVLPVLGFNAFFVLLFVGSAVLFRRASVSNPMLRG